MKKTAFINVILLGILVTGFNCGCSPGDKKDGTKSKTVSSSDNTTLNGAIIKNDIDLNATDVKLKEAYLADADLKPLAENKAAVGEKIY
ncbi:MAG: hypothetical protein ACKOU7_14415, partial [Ferruginibacter sp.]